MTTNQTPFNSKCVEQVGLVGKECENLSASVGAKDKVNQLELLMMIRRRRRHDIGQVRRRRLREAAFRRGLRPRRLNFSFDGDGDGGADDGANDSDDNDVDEEQLNEVIASGNRGRYGLDRDECSSTLTNLTVELDALNESINKSRCEEFRRTWNFDPALGPLPGPWVWQSMKQGEWEGASGDNGLE